MNGAKGTHRCDRHERNEKMLAAGGIIALLMVGFLADGMVSQSEEEDTDAGPEGVRDDADLSGEAGEGEAGASSIADLLFGSEDDDQIAAREGDDTVSGGGGDDHLKGDEGDDWLDGGDGHDTLDGGEGEDHLVLGEGDVGIGGEGADVFQVTETALLETGDPIACVMDFEPGLDQLMLDFTGSEEDAPEISFDPDPEAGCVYVMADGVPVCVLEDVTEMSPEDVVVRMVEPDPDEDWADDHDYDGAEMLDGGSPQDMLDVRSAIDPVFGEGGHDALTGGPNGDAIAGTEDTDAIWGDEGDDSLSGLGGADEIHGDTGDDTLEGGGGADFLSGGDGADSLSGGAGDDVLFGNDGDDTLLGGDGDDILQGGFGADQMDGGAGDDILDGSFSDGPSFDTDGGDTLTGGDGNDTLVLGLGDLATGGDGADTFIAGQVIENAEVAGTVNDFDPTEDVIEVMYDPDLTPDPEITIAAAGDGSGADILLDGQVILHVAGAEGLTADQVVLRAIGSGAVALA